MAAESEGTSGEPAGFEHLAGIEHPLRIDGHEQVAGELAQVVELPGPVRELGRVQAPKEKVDELGERDSLAGIHQSRNSTKLGFCCSTKVTSRARANTPRLPRSEYGKASRSTKITAQFHCSPRNSRRTVARHP